MRSVHYTIESGADRFATPPPAAAARRPDRVRPATARPTDAAAVDEFLQLLARAVQQFHTYPAASPLCLNAIEACRRALTLLESRDHLTFRVAPRELIVDETGVGAGTLVEQELARRLHAAAVAAVTIDRGVTSRELARLCGDLAEMKGSAGGAGTLLDRLVEHGVDRIAIRTAYRPEVLAVGPVPPPLTHVIDREQGRREALLASAGAVHHLYPPDKGWVRLDPTAAFASVSLVDLALLTGDPAQLATMLMRLTDDDVPAAGGSETALEQKFTDVATLFSALEPGLARFMFAKLSQAVLALDTTRRQALLKRTILPGLLDGRLTGSVLADFPDPDLADALCLLLDLETAAPEVITSAIARLHLSEERRAALEPAIAARLRQEPGAADGGRRLDDYARRLVQIAHGEGKSFGDFAAFDLALDADARHTIESVRAGVAGADTAADRLLCLVNLVRLEPNPEAVARFLARARDPLSMLERQERWADVITWLGCFRALATEVRDARPDVADALDAHLSSYCTPQRVQWLADLAAGGQDALAAARTLTRALGPTVAPKLVELIGVHEQASNGQAAMRLLCEHAPLFAPALAPGLADASTGEARAIIRVLGVAGAGYEPVVAEQLRGRDGQTNREALRSLARIGTPRAAAAVTAEIEHGSGWLATAAEETLWHFPPAEVARQVRGLLERREFVCRRPRAASRLLDRAGAAGVVGLDAALQSLVPLRFRLWNPSVVKVARKAQALLHR